MHILPTLTPDLLATSARTLADWRAGRRHPGPAAARLIELHTAGRVMPDSPRWRGWSFHGDFLETISGQTVSPAELDNVRLLRTMLDNAYRDCKALKSALARQDAYIAELEGHRAPANAARL